MADRGEDFLIQEVPKDKRIVTLCKAGLRAYEAKTILAGSGFKDVRVMDGGWKAGRTKGSWRKSNFARGPAALPAPQGSPAFK